MAHPMPRDENLPEVVPDSSPEAFSQAEYYRQQGLDGGDGKYPYGPGWDGEKYTPDPSPLSPGAGFAAPIPESTEKKEKRICGLKRKVFWIVAAVVVAAIIAIAVGVGVGVGRGSSGDGNSGSQDASDAATTSAEGTSIAESTTSSPPTSSDITSSEVSSTASATSSAPEPTLIFLNNQTEPEKSFAFQAYSFPKYGGKATRIITEIGFINLNFTAKSYVWVRNGTACCLTFCQGLDTDVGYWCDSRRQPEASSEFDRIYLWCGQDSSGKKKNQCSET